MIKKNHQDKQPKTFRAKWLMSTAGHWIHNAMIEIAPCGQINLCDQFSNRNVSDVTDLGEGVIMPALINAHTHLELSALKNCIPMDLGFTNWVQHLVETRMMTHPDQLIESARQAFQELWKTGVCAVGEISSLGLTKYIFHQSGLSGCWFREYFGNEIVSLEQDDIQASNCHFSYAGHAPHTTSPDLFRYLKKATSGKPFSIHVAESDVEMSFITQATGDWAIFLESRGVDYLQWHLPQKSPVQHLENQAILDSHTLLVHLLHFDHRDLAIIKNHKCPICICPRSNQNLHQRLADVQQLIQAGLTVSLGTDSLASVDSLSIWDEMAYLWEMCPELAPEEILTMATASGAHALGIANQLGKLAEGLRGIFLYVPVEGNCVQDLASRLVAGDFPINDLRVRNLSF